MTRPKFTPRRLALLGIGVVALALVVAASTEGGNQLLRAQLHRVTDKLDSVVGRRLDRATEAAAQVLSRRGADGASLLFIHHSCGRDWLASGLHMALLKRDYLDSVAEITYGTDVEPDPGRPDSLQGENPPGHYTDMQHWLGWFNDYLGGVTSFGRTKGRHRVVMFKSCYPNSNIEPQEGPIDPFSSHRSIENYEAVYRHPDGPQATYRRGDFTYRPLEQIFASHPDTLFIVVTAPPRSFGPPDTSTDDQAARARRFNHWLEEDWLDSYRTAHPGLDNVAVYNWFERLAYPEDHPHHPGRLMFKYGGLKDSHPNRHADRETARDFAGWLDGVWEAFSR